MKIKKVSAAFPFVLSCLFISSAHAGSPSVAIDGSKNGRTAASCTTPKYPLAAIQAEQSGEVDLSYRVLASGQVSDVATLKGADMPHIRRDAYMSLRRCKLAKAELDSERLTVRYVYALN